MKSKIKASDINLLIQLYTDTCVRVFVFDPFDRLVEDVDLVNTDEESKKVLINLGDEIICYKHMALDEFDYVFCFGKSKIFSSRFDEKAFRFITNKDGSMRWVFQASLARPTFLNFYAQSSWKAKLYAKLVKISYKLRLSNMISSGGFKIYSKGENKVEKVLKAIVPHDNYSIFTGTVGPNRKVVIELNDGMKTTHFAKIALSKNGLELINKEQLITHSIKEKKWKKCSTPTVIDHSYSGITVLENIKPHECTQPFQISDIHIEALVEIAETSISNNQYKWTTFSELIADQIVNLKTVKEIRFREIAKELTQLSLTIDSEIRLPLTIAHGDFTPWNLYLGKDKIHVFDWELCHREAPALFDLFHFVFQSEILINKGGLSNIKTRLDQLFNSPSLRQFVNKHNIDIQLHYKLYLLYNVSYYLNVYNQQTELHPQANWLINVWKEAISELIVTQTEASMRKVFVRQFVNRLANTRYAFLKYNYDRIDDLPETSDIDMVVLKSDLPQMVEYLKKVNYAEKVKVFRKSYMTSVELFFSDGSFLNIDLIHKFIRKGLNYLDNKKILLTACANQERVMTTNPQFNIEYLMLFFTLNGASIPPKYKQYFDQFSFIQKQQTLSYIKSYYELNINTTDDVFTYNNEIRDQLINTLKKDTRNRGVSRFLNQLKYMVDTLKSLINKKGLTITVSGVDGAGKSTMIAQLKNKLEYKFRREVVVLRHRPSLFPILSSYKYGKTQAENKAANTLPRQGTNRGVLSSVLRLAYYYTDYLIGQFVIYFRYVIRGKIVIYDRYYFDFINDSKRSNINMNQRFMKKLYAFLIKPKLNFFLYADSEVIRKRKQELDSQTIDELTHSYQKLFKEYDQKYSGSSYLSIENLDLNSTLNQMIKEYSQAA